MAPPSSGDAVFQIYKLCRTLPSQTGIRVSTKGMLKVGGLVHQLPIPFDGWGNMEVDLRCADSRLVVELDGGQHLASPEAYRRDRRKDALLQQSGYFVLRFLAEDVGTRLDMVLDAILRVLSHRNSDKAI